MNQLLHDINTIRKISACTLISIMTCIQAEIANMMFLHYMPSDSIGIRNKQFFVDNLMLSVQL